MRLHTLNGITRTQIPRKHQKRQPVPRLARDCDLTCQDARTVSPHVSPRSPNYMGTPSVNNAGNNFLFRGFTDAQSRPRRKTISVFGHGNQAVKASCNTPTHQHTFFFHLFYVPGNVLPILVRVFHYWRLRRRNIHVCLLETRTKTLKISVDKKKLSGMFTQGVSSSANHVLRLQSVSLCPWPLMPVQHKIGRKH